jgi:hypothetical protein
VINPFEPDDRPIGVDASGDLNLRASVATLVKVLFRHPDDGSILLALERTATRREIQGDSEVIVAVKPFGGGVRIINPHQLEKLIGHFNYDNERSRQEADFRIQINSASWEKVKEICWDHFKDPDKGFIDSNPEREIAEEFEDTLHIYITRDQYQIKSRGIIVEDYPVRTANIRAFNMFTVRVYYTFEAWIESPEIISRMLANNKRYTDGDLQKMAWHDAQQGGKGRANAILTVRLDDLIRAYQSIQIKERSKPIYFEEHRLNENVLAILDEVEQTRYITYIR